MPKVDFDKMTVTYSDSNRKPITKEEAIRRLNESRAKVRVRGGVNLIYER